MQTASFYHMLSVIYLLIIARTIVLVQIDFLFQFVLNHDMLLFTPFSVTRFAIHRIYAIRNPLPLRDSTQNIFFSLYCQFFYVILSLFYTFSLYQLHLCFINIRHT